MKPWRVTAVSFVGMKFYPTNDTNQVRLANPQILSGPGQRGCVALASQEASPSLCLLQKAGGASLGVWRWPSGEARAVGLGAWRGQG